MNYSAPSVCVAAAPALFAVVSTCFKLSTSREAPRSISAKTAPKKASPAPVVSTIFSIFFCDTQATPYSHFYKIHDSFYDFENTV